MTGSVVVSALIAKAAEVRGRIASLEGQMARERKALEHIKATLRMFDPTQDVRQVKPHHVRLKMPSHFAEGEIIGHCRDALREAAEPLAAEDIARKALAAKGLDPEDRKLRSDTISRVLNSLHGLRNRGQAARLGVGLGSRWRGDGIKSLPSAPETSKI